MMKKDKGMGFDRHGAAGPLQASGGARPPLPPAPALPPLPHAAASVIDPQAIERLRELDPSGQQGVLRRVLQAYETSLGRHLGEIGQAVTAGDAERLSRSAHTLKSSSAAIGAMGFSQRCADVEHHLRSERQLPPAAELQALIDEGRQVLAAVEAMLAA
jgi:HPt (histidine-containing phosphotransfer) domain-containing protein